MRERFPAPRPEPRGRLRWWMQKTTPLLLAGFIGAAATQVTGCAVSESDVHRWERTERGPEKLVAVLTHDKYAMPLRTEAAMSLIRMKPRAGKRIGIDQLIAALATVDEEARRKIVIGMTPDLVKEIEAPPPAKKPDGTMDPDATIPFKDAAFAMMSHDPPLVSDEKSKADLTAALIQWGQTDFEDRIDNSAQAYGVEQMMRFFGAPAVRNLPPLMTEQSTKVDRMASLIADLGDAATKEKASVQLVALAQGIDSAAWVAKERPLVEEANKRSGAKITDQQLQQQLDKFQEQELVKIFTSMRRVGGRPVIDYCLGFAGNSKNSDERRKAALAALENRIDKSATADIDKVFAIAKDEKTPDTVRDLAFARLGELPKDQVVPKLYTLFAARKWKVRWVSASLVLKTMTTKDIPEFMRHLPPTAAHKMGLAEATTYGPMMAKMKAPSGEPTPRDAITPYLASKELGPRLAALGFFYEGKKADVSVVQSHEGDKAPVPKCEKDDECGWTCVVPKAPGSNETEQKTITTVGEFVKFCVEPSMTNK
jgi:hypothetical protein